MVVRVTAARLRPFISNGDRDHAEDQIYNSAPRLTLSAGILHANGGGGAG